MHDTPQEFSLPKAEPHTIAKHVLLKSYLGAWFRIIDQSGFFPYMAYIDSHCSFGEYAGGILGSPVHAFNIANDTEKPLSNKAVLRFIDDDVNCVDYLRQKLTHEQQSSKVDWKVIHAKFENTIDNVLIELNSIHRKQMPLFAFIDPYGIKVPYSIVAKILQRSSAEVFVYLNIPGIVRNLDNEHGKHVVKELYGTEEVFKLRDAPRRSEKLRDLYISQLKKATMTDYSWSFGMFDKHSNLKYYLVFATKHKLGFHRMKEAMWRVDPLGYFQFSDRDQNIGFIFDRPNLSKLKSFLSQVIKRNKRTGKELNEIVMDHTEFLKRHKTETLYELEQEKKISVIVPSGKRRNKRQYPDWCEITWNED